MTTTFAAAQLVANRHEELIAEATEYRQTRISRAERAPYVPRGIGSARRITAQLRSALRTWYAAGQL
jgi:hypothetical protein